MINLMEQYSMQDFESIRASDNTPIKLLIKMNIVYQVLKENFPNHHDHN